MKTYKNTVTGRVITSPSTIEWEGWEEVKKEKPATTTKKKKKTTKKEK